VESNNDRESEFRDLNRRMLSTTGQKGLTRRRLPREGAWELIPTKKSKLLCPRSIPSISKKSVNAFVNPAVVSDSIAVHQNNLTLTSTN
jgi:hypothetical protein